VAVDGRAHGHAPDGAAVPHVVGAVPPLLSTLPLHFIHSDVAVLAKDI
jgi:hypothetical protein